jgi:hypothetical protein
MTFGEWVPYALEKAGAGKPESGTFEDVSSKRLSE